MYIILMYHFNKSLLCNKLDLPSLLVFTWLGLGLFVCDHKIFHVHLIEEYLH